MDEEYEFQVANRDDYDTTLVIGIQDNNTDNRDD